MKSPSLFLLLFFLTGFLLRAQDDADTTKYWKLGGYTALNLNQVSFVNWAAGGENTFSATAIGNFFAHYAKDKHSWENSLDASYGVLRSKEFGWRKNEDKWEVQSKYGYAALENKKLFYTALVNFRSQFAEGFDYPDDTTVISKAMAPGYLLISAGLDYKPVDYFSLYFSPATGKFTFVTDQTIANTGRYGNEPAVFDTTGEVITQGDKIRAEFGAYLSAKFQKDIFKNVNLLSKLELFNNYTDEESRKYMDVNWETTITMKVNKFLSASLILHLIYDHDIDIPDEDNPGETKKAVQFKEVLGVGIAYKFGDQLEKE